MFQNRDLILEIRKRGKLSNHEFSYKTEEILINCRQLGKSTKSVKNP